MTTLPLSKPAEVVAYSVVSPASCRQLRQLRKATGGLWLSLKVRASTWRGGPSSAAGVP